MAASRAYLALSIRIRKVVEREHGELKRHRGIEHIESVHP
jgi:hypothetical protein